MKILAVAVATLLFLRQDEKKPADLIEKLKAATDDKVAEIEQELLAIGEPAREALAAAAKAGDKRAGGVIDKLDVRKRAPELPKLWGDRWYSVYAKTLHVGWLHAKVEETKVGDETLLAFTDEIYLKSDGREIKGSIKSVCRPNEYLSPVTIQANIDNGESPVEFSVEIKKGRLIAKSGGAKDAIKVKPNFTTDFAALRLAALLPATTARPYELQVVPLLEPKKIRNDVLSFEKEEEIEVDGKKIKARRYIWTDDSPEPKDKFLWVDKDSRLVRLQASNDVDITLSTEKEAKDLD